MLNRLFIIFQLWHRRLHVVFFSTTTQWIRLRKQAEVSRRRRTLFEHRRQCFISIISIRKLHVKTTERRDRKSLINIPEEFAWIVTLPRKSSQLTVHWFDSSSSSELSSLPFTPYNQRTTSKRLESFPKHLQGGPVKVRPTYIFDSNIWMHR